MVADLVMRSLPQLSIWTRAPWSDPDTSREAAKAIERFLPRCERLVMDALAQSGGSTAQELEALTGLVGDNIRPRLKALEERGRVVKTDERRRTASGRMAAVWRRA